MCARLIAFAGAGSAKMLPRLTAFGGVSFFRHRPLNIDKYFANCFGGTIDKSFLLLYNNYNEQFGGTDMVEKTILVTSGKGGVGCSTVAARLAVAFARREVPVLLVDSV